MTGAALLRAEPQLLTADLPRACDFYVGVLGFTLAFAYGEPAFYAQVVRDDARLNLRHVDDLRPMEALRAREKDLLAAILVVDDIEPLHRELATADVRLHQDLREEPWGARTFIVADADGNLLLFAGRGATSNP